MSDGIHNLRIEEFGTLRVKIGEAKFAALWGEREALVADGVERVVDYALEPLS